MDQHQKNTQNNVQNNALFINTMFSSQEILLDTSGNLRINEISLFKHANKVVPLDLIQPSPEVSHKLDPQWILFALINLLGTVLFTTMANTQQLPYLHIVTGAFGVLSLLSLLAAWKYKSVQYTYRFKDTGISLLTINAGNIEANKIQGFIEQINERLLKNSSKTPLSIQSELIDQQMREYQSYNQHAQVLYDEGVLDDVLLARIQQKIDQKIFGETESQPLANVIPLPLSR